MRQTMLLITFSLAGCASRPDATVCIVNAPAKNRKCYNLKDDYTDTGQLKANAKPKYLPANSVDDLNKNATVDPDGLAEIKAWLGDMRDECTSR